MSKESSRHKKKSNKNRIIIGVLATICTVIAASVGGGVYYVNHLLNKVDKVEVKEDELSINPEIKEKYSGIKNIALFGIDSEDGITGRSDSIMILTLDSAHNKIKLTSVMRDSYVNIPGYGMDKINHAYAFGGQDGGPELAIKTLNENFNLDIKDFMAVNFSSLPIIIDKVGGVEINITEEEVQHVKGIDSPGAYTLDGEQALLYSRIRYAEGGDYKRTERQRTVVNAIFAKAKTISVSKYPSLISEFLPLIKTNMSPSDLLGLSKDFAMLMSSDLQQDRFPRDEDSSGETIDDIYYLTFDKEATVDQMHKWIFEDIK